MKLAIRDQELNNACFLNKMSKNSSGEKTTSGENNQYLNILEVFNAAQFEGTFALKRQYTTENPLLNQVNLTIPNTQFTSYTWEFPTTIGTAGQILTSGGPGGELTWGGGGGAPGTVTSVGLSLPSQFNSSPSAITTNGVFTVTLNGATGSGGFVLANDPTINILNVTGLADLAGAVDVGGALTVAGATNLTGVLDFTGASATFTIPTTGDFTVTLDTGFIEFTTVGGLFGVNTGAGDVEFALGTGQFSVTVATGDVIDSDAIVFTAEGLGNIAMRSTTGNVILSSADGAVTVDAAVGGFVVGGVAGAGTMTFATTDTYNTNANIVFTTTTAGVYGGPGNFVIDTLGAYTGNITLEAKGNILVKSNANAYGINIDTVYVTPATYNWIYPATAGTAGYHLISGGGSAPMTWSAPTGTGSTVMSNSPTLITPILGAAAATSITTPLIVGTEIESLPSASLYLDAVTAGYGIDIGYNTPKNTTFGYPFTVYNNSTDRAVQFQVISAGTTTGYTQGYVYLNAPLYAGSGGFGTAGYYLVSGGPTAPPTWVSASGGTFNPAAPGPLGNTTPSTANFTAITSPNNLDIDSHTGGYGSVFGYNTPKIGTFGYPLTVYNNATDQDIVFQVSSRGTTSGYTYDYVTLNSSLYSGGSEGTTGQALISNGFSTAPTWQNITGGLTTYTLPFTGAVSRTIVSKFEERISVLDFGADPTGVAASDTAFQNCINAVAAYYSGTNAYSCAMYIPSGYYKLTTGVTFTMTNTPQGRPINVIGDGCYETIIEYSGSTNCFAIATVAPNITWRGFYLLNVGSVGSTCGIYFNGGTEMSQAAFEDIRTYGFYYGMYLKDCLISKIERYLAISNSIGLYMAYGSISQPNVISVTNSTFYGNTIQAVAIYDATNFKFDTCSFEGGSEPGPTAGYPNLTLIQSDGTGTWGGTGEVTFLNCYWEGQYGTEDVLLICGVANGPTIFKFDGCNFDRNNGTYYSTYNISCSSSSVTNTNLTVTNCGFKGYNGYSNTTPVITISGTVNFNDGGGTNYYDSTVGPPSQTAAILSNTVNALSGSIVKATNSVYASQAFQTPTGGQGGAYLGWNRSGAPIGSGATCFYNQEGGGTGGWEWVAYSTVPAIINIPMTLTNSGNLTINNLYTGGIAATGNVSAGNLSNGTFTPTMYGLGATPPTPTFTSFTSNGYYSRVGLFVTVTVIITATYYGSGGFGNGGQIWVGGLPQFGFTGRPLYTGSTDVAQTNCSEADNPLTLSTGNGGTSGQDMTFYNVFGGTSSPVLFQILGASIYTANIAFTCTYELH